MRKSLPLLIALAFAGMAAPALAKSSWQCPKSAQYYQDRYKATGDVGNLSCMKAALTRELSGGDEPLCFGSAEKYRKAYAKSGNMRDLSCFRAQLRKEMGG